MVMCAKTLKADPTLFSFPSPLSGGELFDHILAHKYLKERDACRLFAQLISGVSYLHHKKIVHRDLKLENLLLDRNRNVIITDFGFANNFENRKDDLMATSCGSPCYAAPELVVQDGLYAGSAVDVWSCGVILYAMLAGYLPYDDDPKNPEGDNINLLYKYIMATPLSFPDYISAEPRDLLCKMLVPDPLKRADLETVMSHAWLAPYRDLFRFSVEDLERAAIEQQNKKRMVYRQQMMMQQQLVEQQAGKGSRSSGSTATDASSIKQMRHQSAVATTSTMPDRMYDAGLSAATARSRPVTGLPTPIAPVEIPAPLDRETPRGSLEQPLQNLSAAPFSTTSATSKKSAGQKAQRHTVQLEYTGDAAEQKKREAEVAARSAILNEENIPPVPRMARPEDAIKSMIVEKEYSPLSEVIMSSEPAYISAKTAILPAAERKTSINAKTDAIVTMNGKEEDRSNGKIPSAKRNSVALRGSSNPLPVVATSDVVPNRIISGGAGPQPEGRNTRSSSGRPTTATPSKVDQAASEKAANRHRKGMSTDKAFFSRLMSSTGGGDATTTTNNNNLSGRSRVAQVEEMPATPNSKAEAASSETGRKTSSNRRKAMSLVVGRYGDQLSPAIKDREKASANKAIKEEKRLTGRIRKTTLTKENGNKLETPVKSSGGGAAAASPSTPSLKQQQQQHSPSAASVMTTNESLRQSSRSSNKAGGTPFDQRFNESTSTVGPSTNAAKKVMDWFRKKSLSRGGFDEKPPLGPFEAEQRLTNTPRLVVTNDAGKEEKRIENAELAAHDSVPSSRSTSGTHSESSQATDATGLTTATEDSLIGGNSGGGNKSSSSTVQQQPTPRASTVLGPKSRVQVDDSALRVHQGAVDQSALTSRAPDDVIRQVQKALFDMGIEAKKEREEEYKFECIRRKRTKTLMGATQGLGLSIRTSVFPPSQAELERSGAAVRQPSSPGGYNNPGQLSASPSSLRNFLKRGASQHNASISSGTSDDPTPTPLYGETSVDGGQEVRFSVEITKIKNLPGLYSLDIRRLKGNLWAYKFLYHALLDRCQLSARLPPGIAS